MVATDPALGGRGLDREAFAGMEIGDLKPFTGYRQLNPGPPAVDTPLRPYHGPWLSWLAQKKCPAQQRAAKLFQRRDLCSAAASLRLAGYDAKPADAKRELPTRESVLNTFRQA